MEIRGAKSRMLLAALLFQPNRSVSLSSLREALWAGEPPATATASLHNHAVRLRRALGEDGEERLRSTPYGYRLSVRDGELDAREFTRLLADAQAARARQDWPEVGCRTTAALALWRGEPLADLPGPVGLRSEVQHLVEARLQALEWHFEAELELGRHAEVAPELSRWSARYPLNEALHAQLITALYRSGRQADALRAYDGVRRRLAEELGVDPGPDLRTLHQRVLDADPALLRRPGAAAGLVGQAPPAAAVGEPVPASRAARSTPSQLPSGTADFTGRTAELAVLTEVLTASASAVFPQVVVVTGMGGVGKTALAVHAGQRLRHLFPDGQLYVDLRGLGPDRPRDPHDLLAGFLTDLGGPVDPDGRAQPIPEHTDDRAALLRSELAERRVLLVLDNARDTAQVLPLLPGNGRCAVIVTSRGTLTDLPAAAQLRLGPLDREEQHALLETLCGPERVRREPAAAHRIIAACAGLPLALRIIGARLSARPCWPLETFVQHLDAGCGRLPALTAGHLAVRDTFASSYLLLRCSKDRTEREAARAFRLLGLRPGRLFDAESAAALLDRSVDVTADLLELLTDTHLLQTPEPLRYRFHGLIEEYAAERLEEEEPPEERRAARERLSAWHSAARPAAP
ncbi:BTAD domain-containing putative transcriptional regulator [Kitasatospora sp. NPDC049258]|uniref:AfsR/SARP family transcriptional regulator n=1 Tax=Kitasatospora sp. NPDC049258 TaxID=3155394 RepID=UPI00343314B3